MTIELIKRLLDACYEAKRIRDMLPPLPDGVTPSYRCGAHKFPIYWAVHS